MPITLPLNPKYRPDTCRWVCTCPQFSISHFLVCKHLVQAVKPVDLIFFLQVSRNRTTPFWSHPFLVPLNSVDPGARSIGPAFLMPREDPIDDDEDDEVISVVDMEQTGIGYTFDERLDEHIKTIEDFLGGLEYQRQFRDHRILATLEREGAGFLRLARNCLDHERRYNSSQTNAPTTWERGSSNAMFYRTRPRAADSDT
jgi:hypothetical protein